MFRFQLDVSGEIQMDRGIGRFADGLTDYSPLWPIIVEEFHAEEQGQFESQGAQGGEVWAPLSPAYAGWKEQYYPGMPILQRTGALYRSLTREGDPNAVVLKGRKDLRLGTRIPYAIFHQSIEPRKVLPRRPPILLTERFKRWTMRQVHVYLVEMATRVGFRAGLTPLQVSAMETAQRRREERVPAGANLPARGNPFRQRDSRGRFTR